MVTTRIKQLAIWGIIAFGVYFLLSNHLIFFGKTVKLLKKSELSLNNTFVNLELDNFRTPEDILRNEDLRKDGIGDVMVDLGIITDDQRQQMVDNIESGKPSGTAGAFK